MKVPGISSLFIIEGCIEALHVTPGAVNLISDIQSGAFYAGAINGLAGEAAAIANSASIVMYDGEEVEHLAIVINGRLVVGTFPWPRDLRDGDEVKLVVSAIEDGPLFAHAILRNDDQLLWTPYSISHTRHGWILHALKLGLFLLVGTWMIIGPCYLFGSRPSNAVMTWSFICSLLMIAFVVSMSTRSVIHLGDEAEAIFQALNVPKYERFRIKPFSVLRMCIGKDPHRLRKGYIFHFSDALNAHKKKFNLA
jgi:hypothetical protein